MSKRLERCVHTHIYSHVEDLLYPEQHAFRKHKSCVTQLVQYTHSLKKTLDSGGQSDAVIYLDMAKAFDRVPPEKLMYKLEMLGFRNPLLAWIKDYLTNRQSPQRRHCVRLETSYFRCSSRIYHCPHSISCICK